MRINYGPCFETMEKKGITTYELIHNHNISSRVIDCLRHNKNMNIHTLGMLCETLECNIEHVVKIEIKNN